MTTDILTVTPTPARYVLPAPCGHCRRDRCDSCGTCKCCAPPLLRLA